MFIYHWHLSNTHFKLWLICQVREREDDEIVEALNRYTIKLQNSLQIINSTEMWFSPIFYHDSNGIVRFEGFIFINPDIDPCYLYVEFSNLCKYVN